MNVQWFFISVIVILPCIQGVPMNTDVTPRLGSPGQIIELILNVVKFASEVKKKLTDAPSTVINIREREERAPKALDDVRDKLSPRNLMFVSVNESEKNEENERKSLLQRVVGWVFEQSGGAKTKIGDVSDCIQGKEQEIMNVAEDVKRELQRCFSASGEGQPVKNISKEQGTNSKGDVREAYSAGREEKEEGEVTAYTGEDFNANEGRSAEELMKILLNGQNCFLDAYVQREVFGIDRHQEKEDKINSDIIVNTKILGKNNSKIPFMMAGDDKKLSEDTEDNSKTIRRSPQENAGIQENVSAPHDLELSEDVGDVEQRTKDDGRTTKEDRATPKRSDESGVKDVAMNTTTPPDTNVVPRPSQPLTSQSTPSNVSCVTMAIQTGRQKIDNVVRQINHCFLH